MPCGQEVVVWGKKTSAYIRTVVRYNTALRTRGGQTLHKASGGMIVSGVDERYLSAALRPSAGECRETGNGNRNGKSPICVHPAVDTKHTSSSIICT